MGNTKKYWTGLSDLHQTEEFKAAVTNEFPQDTALEEFLGDEKLKESSSSRRDFLKFMGFSISAATLAACETPVIKSIPYVNKPEQITPGIANYYASTYYDGQDYGNILVKTREGRPIHIRSNKDHGLNMGVNSRINASVLGLYDSARLTGPMKAGQAIGWDVADSDITTALSSAQSVRILSNTVVSPTLQRAINQFATKYNSQLVSYDTVSYSGIRKAHQASFGKTVLPKYDFSKAKAIVSVAADFLGSWVMPNHFMGQYASTRKPENGWMSKHYQFETVLSLAGSNSDVRIPIKPSEEGRVVTAIYNEVASKTGGAGVSVSTDGLDIAAIKAAAAELLKNKGASLLVAGSNQSAVQEIVNATNYLLGNYGSTIDASSGVELFKGDEMAMSALIADMNAGKVDVLIINGVNPAYSWPDAEGFKAALSKVKTTVSTSLFADETASLCNYICPDNHYLESWNDFELMKGRIDIAQPTIQPLFKSRQVGASLLTWAGDKTDYYTYLRLTWNPAYTASMMNSDNNWNTAVHNGMLTLNSESAAEALTFNNTAATAASSLQKPMDGMELALYQKVGIGTGNQAGNPWLQELPDPMSKVTWDNYITMCPSDITEFGYNMHISQEQRASMATLTVGNKSVTLPVLAQPGQRKGTIGLSIGYGRGANGEAIGRAAFQTTEEGVHELRDGKLVPIGANAYPFMTMLDGACLMQAANVKLDKIEDTYALASTQIHHTVMDREGVLKETSLASFLVEKDKLKGEASFNRTPSLVVHEDMNGDNEFDARDKKPTSSFDLWHEHPVENVGHRWGMTIDLNSCIGCGSCVTSCHIENNVPVVGKDEVRRARDMHWMRIDRYFSSDMSKEKGKEQGLGVIETYGLMEYPEDNPQTVHMPMLCQHCNHAPCETVCPVAATTHSNEGLNQMTYNRCIGTRYCANNCPFKVRRFNWFNYQAYKKFQNSNPAQDSLTRMVLNPDVTVRSRGVMEKCSMCVQRIQSGKLAAKSEGRPVKDGEIVTACAEACPTNAISFGDLNDKGTNNYKRSQNVRAYHALEEIGVKPNIFYLTKVRNSNETEA